jgi:hypothetical protein
MGMSFRKGREPEAFWLRFLPVFVLSAAYAAAAMAPAYADAPSPAANGGALRIALSDLQQLPAPDDTRSPVLSEEDEQGAFDGTVEELPDGDGDTLPSDEGASAPEAAPTAVLYDEDLLPEPTARMRQLIIEAASTGDIEALRPLIGIGPERTRLAIGAIDDDPIDYLMVSSGDGEGQEILAIILDLLDAGFVSVEQDGEEDLYLWPYFFAMPLEELTAPQRVELFRIVTAGDYEEMKLYGGYNFYRIGITASGEWSYFIAGD